MGVEKSVCNQCFGGGAAEKFLPRGSFAEQRIRAGNSARLIKALVAESWNVRANSRSIFRRARLARVTKPLPPHFACVCLKARTEFTGRGSKKVWLSAHQRMGTAVVCLLASNSAADTAEKIKKRVQRGIRVKSEYNIEPGHLMSDADQANGPWPEEH